MAVKNPLPHLKEADAVMSFLSLCVNTRCLAINNNTYCTPGKLSQVPPAEVLIIGCDRRPELPGMVKI